MARIMVRRASVTPTSVAFNPAMSPRSAAGIRRIRSPRTPPKSGRQRPALGDRKGGERAGAKEAGGNPGDRAKRAEPGGLAHEHAPAPEGRRQEQERCSDAEKLHDEVGGHGAGIAEEVLRRRVDGDGETRIVDMPGRERNRDGREHGDDGKAAQAGEIAPEETAQPGIARHGHLIHRHCCGAGAGHQRASAG